MRVLTPTQLETVGCGITHQSWRSAAWQIEPSDMDESDMKPSWDEGLDAGPAELTPHAWGKVRLPNEVIGIERLTNPAASGAANNGQTNIGNMAEEQISAWFDCGGE